MYGLNLKKLFCIYLCMQMLLVSLFTLGAASPAKAAGTTFSVTNIKDAGEGSLRQAIIDANSNDNPEEQDSIEFSIAGPADYTIGGQNGYTIKIERGLPEITQSVAIRASSQPGFSTNTAVSPLPFNGKHVVEIDANNMPHFDNGGGERCLTITDTNEVVIADLVINHCANDAIAVQSSSNVSIEGNYIGTDPTGTIKKPNGGEDFPPSFASGVFIEYSKGVTVGGISPSQRNVISNNSYGDIFVSSQQIGTSTRTENLTIQGNYTGLSANGVAEMRSGCQLGIGNSILVTDLRGMQIGGSEPGAGNVIATSSEYGISMRSGTEQVAIQGNYIGTDYTGNHTVAHSLGNGHPGTGISVAAIYGGGYRTAPHDIMIGGSMAGAGNVISGNDQASEWASDTPGVFIHEGAHDVSLQGNKVGVGADGLTPLRNGSQGVLIQNDQPTVGNVQAVTIGGVTSASSNVIANNADSGITVRDAGSKISILRNSIYNNSGLGIDLGGDGLTANDPLDVDNGPNGLLNSPVHGVLASESGNTTVPFKLDAPAGDYRIEFYSNVALDPSENGEGQTYLGATSITSLGTGPQSYSHTLNGVSSVANLTLTATAIDPSASSGFGPTSEFGAAAPLVSDLAAATFTSTWRRNKPGESVDITKTITNNGPDPIDLTKFNGSGDNPLLTSIAYFFLPPDISYVSTVGSYISCQNYGRVGDLSLAFAQHPDYQAIFCKYTGSSKLLPPGQKISFKLHTVLGATFGASFNVYSCTMGTVADPEYDLNLEIANNAFTNSTDYIDGLIASPTNNFNQTLYRTK